MIKLDFTIQQKKAIKAEESKILCVAQAAAGKTYALTSRIRYLIEVKKVNPSKIVVITFTNLAADEMKKRLGVSAKGAFVGTVHSYANKLCLSRGYDTNEFIINEEFDKIIQRALTIPQRNLPHIEHLLVDESQDLTPLDYNFLRYLEADNVFYCGDYRQCQPAGTLVLTSRGEEKIEDLIIGDSVITFDNNGNEQLKRIEDIAIYPYSGLKLLKVTLSSKQSSYYTPFHLCYVRLNDKNVSFVCLLQDNKTKNFSFAIINNKTKFDKKFANKKVWLLNYYYIYEKKNCQLQLIKNKLNFLFYKEKFIDKLFLEKENLSQSYPFATNIEQLINFFNKGEYMEIYCCNLFSRIMSMQYLTKDRKMKESPIYLIEKKNSRNNVFGLQVNGGLYIADNILTHNCIYEFRGAKYDYFIDMLKDESYTKYYLTQNFRNCPEIIKFAEDKIATMDKDGQSTRPMVQRKGYIETECNFIEILEDLEEDRNWRDWFILARTNKEVNILRNILNSKRIPNVTFKISQTTLGDISKIMESNAVKVLTIHQVKGLEAKNVIVVGVNLFNDEERRIAYVAATRAKDSLYWCPTVNNAEYKKKFGKKIFDNGVLLF